MDLSTKIVIDIVRNVQRTVHLQNPLYGINFNHLSNSKYLHKQKTYQKVLKFIQSLGGGLFSSWRIKKNLITTIITHIIHLREAGAVKMIKNRLFINIKSVGFF